MKLLGKHQITFDQVRSIAIQCYALDVAAYHLFMEGTHLHGVEKTKVTYEELLTNHLLNLAIALRTKFYQGLEHHTTIPHVLHSGFLYKQKNNQEETLDFSVKDVCDKIIHANSIFRFLEPGMTQPVTTFFGTDPRNDSTWELSMSVSLFIEGIMNWLHEIEAMQSTCSTLKTN